MQLDVIEALHKLASFVRLQINYRIDRWSSSKLPNTTNRFNLLPFFLLAELGCKSVRQAILSIIVIDTYC